ncbi:MAG: type II secretion system protein, partial [Alphaproteobacteria bacterium]
MTVITIQNRRTERGFTLVELAIVMIIIGLLIGGVLKGQELISNARVTSTIAGIRNYDVAINTFREKYAALPGDMQNSGTRLANCTGSCVPPAAPAVGNGRIDTNDFSGAPVGENLAAFQQLNSADMISGINPNLGAVWGGIFPSSQMGGGFHIAYVAAAAGIPGSTPVTIRTGHYLALHNNQAAAVTNLTSAVTPNQAFRVDNKLDDSVPT